MRRHRAQLVEIELAVVVTHPILGGTDLVDHVAAAFQMVRTESALAGIHAAAGQRRTARQRTHCRLRNGAVAHAADVDQRAGHERLVAPAFADDQRRRRLVLTLQHRKRRVDENQRPGVGQVVGRAKAENPAFVLCHAIHPGPGRPIEGHFLAVAKKEILTKILSEILEKETQTADDRKIAQHGMTLLGDIPDIQVEHAEGECECGQDADAYMKDADHFGHAIPQTVQFGHQHADSQRSCPLNLITLSPPRSPVTSMPPSPKT